MRFETLPLRTGRAKQSAEYGARWTHAHGSDTTVATAPYTTLHSKCQNSRPRVFVRTLSGPRRVVTRGSVCVCVWVRVPPSSSTLLAMGKPHRESQTLYWVPSSGGQPKIKESHHHCPSLQQLFERMQPYQMPRQPRERSTDFATLGRPPAPDACAGPKSPSGFEGKERTPAARINRANKPCTE